MNRPTAGLDPFARRCIAAGAMLMLARRDPRCVRRAPAAKAGSPRGSSRATRLACTYQLLHALGLVLVGLVAPGDAGRDAAALVGAR